MRYLNQFLIFDANGFFQDKALMVSEPPVPWLDHEDKNVVLGTIVPVVIISDGTNYGEGKLTAANRFERLRVKLPQRDLQVPVNSVVRFEGLRAVVWGQYHNELSVKADSFEIVSQNEV